jgi:hypothetical protein
MTATARRGHGEGSVYRDAANGTWVAPSRSAGGARFENGILVERPEAAAA